ncbi:reverse transcriptase domain-containing protein [Tanacetum coccineum]|uniref:Reverse transcriptase domain-containing protein n=1 Tax=Tanacetum coccineum TaxID=301880 RepID=A0ABQ5J9Z9_9ASTR
MCGSTPRTPSYTPLIPCNFNKAFSCNALADFGASINLMPYSLYAKLSLETLKPTKMSVKLADRSFQYPVGIAENMLVEVGKFTFPADFVILEMEEDSKVPLILGRLFLHTDDAVIRVKHKQLNLGVRAERMIFNINSAMKHSYSNDDTCFSIDVIDEILEDDFDALFNEGSEIFHSIEWTILEEKLFTEFDKFMAMTADENSESESDTKEPPFEKITFNTDYKIKTSLKEPPTDLELKPLPDNLKYAFLEEPSFLPVIISSQLSEQNKNNPLVSLIHCVPKKGSITVVTNEKDELVPTRTVTCWRKKRKAQVQFEAQHYTNEDWDLIRAKLEANAELSKSILGSESQGEDFAKKMVDLVNQRKKYFAEQRAKAKRNKPMTQTQLNTYMMNYLKNQGTWKLSQLKSLSFEEIKKEFDKLVKQVESFAPISFEATKASLKRFGEELQTKTPKRLKDDKDDEAKNDEQTKKYGKRRKQMARKGLHTSVDKDDSEDSDEVSEQEESVIGTKTLINHDPVSMKTPSIATYKIIKQGEKGVYQIVREDGTNIVYINFGAMMKSIFRDDLTELYRIVMNKYGMNGPEDELQRVFWKYLKNMFEEPLSTDSIWSEVGHQKIISWRYYESCRVHCLNLESMDLYMLIERIYPLSAEMCKAMLDKKLQGGKPDENCYRMLKIMEKQAGIRK